MRRAFAALVAVSIGAATASADPGVAVPENYRMDDYRAAVPDTVPGATVLHTAELQAAVAGGSVVLIDVVPAPRKPPGMQPGVPWLPPRHHSLPGALWWPEIGRGAISPSVEARLKQRLGEVTIGHPRRLVVFYCLPDCWMSWNAARRVAAMGFHAGWYPEGVDGWRDAGLPLQDVRPERIE